MLSGTIVSLASGMQVTNGKVVLETIEATNTGDLDGLAALVAEDYLEHDPAPGQAPGRVGMEQARADLAAAFPDFRLTPEDVLCEHDLVFVRGTLTGTHRGPFAGVPPTGKQVEASASRLFRVYGGQIVEGWANVNTFAMLQQLGVVPTPPGGPVQLPPAPRVDSTPSRREARAIMHSLIEGLWNAGDLALADELFHPLATSPSAPQLPPGPDGVRAIASIFRTAFPDYWIRIEHLVADGDLVAARLRQGGTHLGDLMGIPPTGRQATWTEMGFLRIGDGQIIQSWYDVDMLGLMGQLGMSPAS